MERRRLFGVGERTTVLRTYRADVRPYLGTGPKQRYQVRLADSGSNGRRTPLTLGATLVIIYRELGQNIPLTAITIYDGSFSPSNAQQSMILQSFGGFYDAASPYAEITHIVGNGQSNKSELVYLGSGSTKGVNLPSIYTGLPPFPGKYAGAWDNPTWPLDPAHPIAALQIKDGTASTEVDPTATNSGCVSWGAVILAVPVEDTDRDGLLDAWEQGQGYTDWGTRKQVSLPGADPYRKDIFAQVDYMNTAKSSGGEIAHSHAPKAQALEVVGNASANAPVCVTGPDKVQRCGIKVHFDVGKIQCNAGSAYCFNGNGGNGIDEDQVACTDIPSANFYCEYPNQPGLTGWKSGLTLFKNNFFPAEEKDSYHYIFFGHNLAVPLDKAATTWKTSDRTLLSITCCQAAPGGFTIATVNTGGPLPGFIVPGARVTVSGSLASLGLNGTYLVQQATGTSSFTIKVGNPNANPPIAVAPGTYQMSAPSNSITVFADPSLVVSYLPPGPGGTIPIRSISGWSDLGGGDSMITLLAAPGLPISHRTTRPGACRCRRAR